MTGELRWADPQLVDGVITHAFSLDRLPATVPGVAWYTAKAATEGKPLVLLGHGGGSDKLSPRNARLAAKLVNDFQINAVAIDGPFHGERSLGAGVDYQAAMSDEGVDAVVARVVNEWLDVLYALRSHPMLAYDSVGYLGLSMGSRFGIPLAAELGERLSVAVLGKYGVRHSGLLHPGLNRVGHTLAAARNVKASVLFHIERRDEVFLYDDQVRLFDALSSEHKTLLTRDGTHGTSRRDDECEWLNFLRLHLVASGRAEPGRAHARD